MAGSRAAAAADGITGLQIFRGSSTATDMLFADGFEPGDMSNWTVIAQ